MVSPPLLGNYPCSITSDGPIIPTRLLNPEDAPLMRSLPGGGNYDSCYQISAGWTTIRNDSNHRADQYSCLNH